jgi:hypothetical protein
MPPLTAGPTVRLIWRGIDGKLVLEGTFEVLHRELVDGDRIALTLGDEARRVCVVVPCSVLDEVAAAPDAASIRQRMADAEDRLIDRLAG